MKNWSKSITPAEATLYAAIIGAIALIITTCVNNAKTAEEKLTALPPTATQEPARDYYVPFSNSFPPNTWSEGSHSYQFSANCPDPINSTKADESIYAFNVSASTSTLNVPLYIRRGGIYSHPTKKDETISIINPSETTIFIYTPYLITYEDAQQAKANCNVTVSFDGNTPIQLLPGDIQLVSE